MGMVLDCPYLALEAQLVQKSGKEAHHEIWYLQELIYIYIYICAYVHVRYRCVAAHGLAYRREQFLEA